MSIPANALSDEECLHYAALDPAAAAELTRRLTSQSIDPSAEREDLRDEVRMLESRNEDQEDEINNLQSYASTACEYIRRAMDPDECALTVNELLQKALDCLE